MNDKDIPSAITPPPEPDPPPPKSAIEELEEALVELKAIAGHRSAFARAWAAFEKLKQR